MNVFLLHINTYLNNRREKGEKKVKKIGFSYVNIEYAQDIKVEVMLKGNWVSRHAYNLQLWGG